MEHLQPEASSTNYSQQPLPTMRKGKWSARMRKWWKGLLQVLSKMQVKRLDRYIIVKFLSTYIFLITIIITIAIIFDFNERIDKFTQSHVSMQKVIFDYYLNFIPYFINLFSPLFVFIAVIFFTTKLADNSEIIAMKAAGMSFRRLLRPYMFSAALIAICTFVLGAYVIPKGNVAKVNFENTYIKKFELWNKQKEQAYFVLFPI